jgi:hypothetical protein
VARAKRGGQKNKTPEADFQKELVSTLMYALPEPYAFFASMVGVNVGAFKGEELRDMGVRADYPDLNILNMDTGAWRGLELKSKTGSLRPGQRRLIDRMAGKIKAAKTLDQAQAALLGWGIPLTMPLRFANKYQAPMWGRMTIDQQQEEWTK